MNNYKYYRVRKIQDNSKKTLFRVEACGSWLDVLFGDWDFYDDEYFSLNEAKGHIEDLISHQVSKKISTVFKRTVK